MARKSKEVPNPTAETLRDLEESGDRVAEWASENAAVILGAIAAILVIAGGVGLYLQAGENERDEGADALAIATSQYRQAMGADPIEGPIPEPANAEVALETRNTYVERFSEVGRAHAGTTAGAVAWLEAGHLQTELGRIEDAAASFARARESASGTAIAAIGAVRLAGLAEDRGDFAAAAEAHEAASQIDKYPLRAQALADATRCWVTAGNPEKAIALYERLEADFPDEVVPPAIASQIAELRSEQG